MVKANWLRSTVVALLLASAVPLGAFVSSDASRPASVRADSTWEVVPVVEPPVSSASAPALPGDSTWG